MISLDGRGDETELDGRDDLAPVQVGMPVAQPELFRRLPVGAVGVDDERSFENARPVSPVGTGVHPDAATGGAWNRAGELEAAEPGGAGAMQGDRIRCAASSYSTRGGGKIKAIVADLQAQRKEAQPTNKRTYGSVFKNPDHELSAGRMLEACGLKGHRIGGAQISPRHANFIENADGARSADAIALMIEARRRAWEQFGVELEHEVEFLGAVELPPISG